MLQNPARICVVVALTLFAGTARGEPRNIRVNLPDARGRFAHVLGTNGFPVNGNVSFLALYRDLGFRVIRTSA